MVPARFHPVDYVLFAGTLAISLGIGLGVAYCGRKQASVSSYFMGNRTLSLIPVVLSLLMTQVSAILFLGNAAEMYTSGTAFMYFAIGLSLGNIAVAFVIVPILYPVKLTSIMEYLKLRYKSRQVVILGCIYIIAALVIFTGIAIYAPATALEAVTGFPSWVSILSMGLIATIYTALGGMKAVIWTDVFQSIIYLAGIILIVVMGLREVGGFDEVLRICGEYGRLRNPSLNPDPTERLSIWSLALGGMVAQMYRSGGDQSIVQRFCALPSMTQAKLSLLLFLVPLIVLFLLTCFVGLIVFTYYIKTGCDPLAAGYISNANQIVPYFIQEVVNFPGVPGIFIAVLFSGALSTVSSNLNALAAIIWKDFLEDRLRHLQDKRKILVTQILAFMFGVLSIVMAFVVLVLGGNVMQLTIGFAGAMGGPILGLFLLGGVSRKANHVGASVGSLVAFSVCLTLVVGSSVMKPFKQALNTTIDMCANFTLPDSKPILRSHLPWIFSISNMYYTLIGVLLTIVIGIVLSLLTGGENSDESLLIPCFRAKHHKAKTCMDTYLNQSQDTKL